ncbi:MAG: hypothetical protein MJ247_02325 [Alphaproteobacteria bacterium]|nr:hypothetical protein [Alphaproteobacteria bacterium]
MNKRIKNTFKSFLTIGIVSTVSIGLMSCSKIFDPGMQAGRPIVNLVRADDMPTEPVTTHSAQMLSLETPIRCNIGDNQQKIVSTLPFESKAFKLNRPEISDPLPRYEVRDFSFENETAERVFYKLLKDAKIKVKGVDGPFPSLSVESISGELAFVMEKIAEAADVYYLYSREQKTLIVSREVKWELKVPGNREVMVSVLDALRGEGMQDLLVNWQNNTIQFSGDKAVERKVRSLIADFDKEPILIVFDARVLRVKPFSKEINWQDLTKQFGTRSIKYIANGVLGRFIVTSHDINIDTLREFLAPRANTTMISEGVFFTPNRWRARFDVGRCGYISMPEAQLSILAKSQLKGSDKLETEVTLDSMNGEITHFDAKSSIGDSIVLIGVPSTTFSTSLQGYETVVVLTPHLIRLVEQISEE